jgi:hypothetical protein
MPPTKTGKLPEAPDTGRILWLIAGPKAETRPTRLFMSLESSKNPKINDNILKDE